MILLLESFLLHLLNFFFPLTQSYGVSLLLLSATTMIITSPLIWLTSKLTRTNRKKRDALSPYLQKINEMHIGRSQKGNMVDVLYKEFDYNPLTVFYDILPLCIQLPFLFAAFYMITNNISLFDKSSFLFFQDLSQPDGLLFGANLLPILMSIITVCASLVMPSTNKTAIQQNLLLAAVFLFLLYRFPAAVVLYWTTNNAITLVKFLIQRVYHARQSSVP